MKMFTGKKKLETSTVVLFIAPVTNYLKRMTKTA